jgi:hypothetical protein
MSQATFLDYKKALDEASQTYLEVPSSEGLDEPPAQQNTYVFGSGISGLGRSDVHLLDSFADTAQLRRKLIDYERAFQETDEEMAGLLRNLILSFVVIASLLVWLLK